MASSDFAEIPVDNDSEEGFVSSWRKIGTGPLLVTTLIMSYTCFSVNLVYYGALYAFPNLLPTLYSASPDTSSPATQLMVGALWELPGIALAIFFGMCMPRRPVMKMSLLLLMGSLLLFVGGATGGMGFAVIAWHVG